MAQPVPATHLHHPQFPSSKPRRSSIAVYELLNHHSHSANASLQTSPSSSLPSPSTPSLSHLSPIRKRQQSPHAIQRATTRGPWRIEEDNMLRDLVGRYGPRNWSAIASHFSRRSGKQARERWMNQLNPALKKKNWTAKEDTIILQAKATLGNKWSAIAQRLPGRTDNSVKNRYNSTLTRAIRERRQANDSLDIQEVVRSLHARPFYHDSPCMEQKRFRSEFYYQPTNATLSSATYDSNSSEERDLWIRGGSTNTPMTAGVALESDSHMDSTKWGDSCLPSISHLPIQSSMVNETANNRPIR